MVEKILTTEFSSAGTVSLIGRMARGEGRGHANKAPTVNKMIRA